MKFKLEGARLSQVSAFLAQNEDCEEIASGDFVADLFDESVPITLSAQILKDGIAVDAAAELEYVEAEDAYAMGEPVSPEAAFAALLRAAGV